MAAAMAEASLMAYEDLVWAQGVTVWAATRWVGDPFPDHGLHELAQHSQKPMLDG